MSDTNSRSFKALLRRGSLWSAAFQVSSKLSLFAISAVVARNLPPADFASYLSVQGLVVLCSAIADRGVSLSVEREFARGIISERDLRDARNLRFRESLLLFCVIVAIGVIFSDLGVLAIVGFALAGASLLTSTLGNAALQAKLLFRQSALTQGGGRIVYLILASLASALKGDVGLVALAWGISESLVVMFQLASLGRFNQGRTTVKRLVLASGRASKRALPYWLATIAYLGYNRADAAAVYLLGGQTAGAAYAPATSLQTALMVIPATLTTSLAVVGAHHLKTSEMGIGGLARSVRNLGALSVTLSAVTSLIVCVFSTPILRIALGFSYEQSATPLAILVWSLPFNAAQAVVVGLLIAAGRPKDTTWFYVACFVSAFLLLMILTPANGAVGAAIASLIREPVGLAVGLYLLRRAATKEREAAEGPSWNRAG